MATDLKVILESLGKFYDFTKKTIVAVGAGGGQLIEYARPARKVWAVDVSDEAMKSLRDRVESLGWTEKYEFTVTDFMQVNLKADVVFFEFCLHEMAAPAAVLEHAVKLASDILIIDHLPDSPWSHLTAEDNKVAASWEAIHATCLRRFVRCKTEGVFSTFAEMEAKCRPQGEESLKRIARYSGQNDIRISMPYGIALI